MANYVIGDVHGCYNELNQLLKIIKFNPSYDKLIFVGDLVGRGPHSLEVLNLIISLGKSAVSVLGNYDLKLLATYYKIIDPSPNDNLDAILKNNNIEKYILWLASLNFLYLDKKLKIAVSHAGIPPNWGIDSTAYKYAKFAKDYININGMKNSLSTLYYNQVLNIEKINNKETLFQYIIFGFTRLRYCISDTNFDSEHKENPFNRTNLLYPWFSIRKKRKNKDYNLFFGHWATLGLYIGDSAICCDAGCVFGGSLTAFKVEEELKIFQVNSTHNVLIQ